MNVGARGATAGTHQCDGIALANEVPGFHQVLLVVGIAGDKVIPVTLRSVQAGTLDPEAFRSVNVFTDVVSKIISYQYGMQ